MNKKLLILLTILLFTKPCLAQSLTENEASPSVMAEPEAKLIITEVNFKNSQADWAEIYYESPSQSSLNLNGISFADDGKFKTLSDFTVQSGQYLLLTFKSTAADKPPYLYTARSGLTGTTEQLIIYDSNGKILDAVCWTSSTPTSDEIKDMLELYQNNGWHTADSSSCIKSESVKNNESVARSTLEDTDSAADWIITENITPGAANTAAVENPDSQNTDTAAAFEDRTDISADGSTTNTNPEAVIIPTVEDSLSTDNNSSTAGQNQPQQKNTADTAQKNTSSPKAKTTTTGKSTAKKNTTPKKSSTTKQSSNKTAYKNGDLSDDIIISELMPNPVQDDTKNEWIELANTGEKSVNLGNWTLDDGENGSKPYYFSDKTVIAGGGTLLIGINESKISLANKEDMVRMFDFNSQLKDEIAYQEAPEGQSYGLINVTAEDNTTSPQWFWIKVPTPEQPNPQYDDINAEVTTEPQFDQLYSFQVKTSDAKTINVYFTEDLIPGPLAKATLLKGTKLKLLLQKNAEDNYNLIRYDITAPGSENQNGDLFIPGLIGSFATAGGSAIYFLRKKIPLLLFNRTNK